MTGPVRSRRLRRIEPSERITDLRAQLADVEQRLHSLGGEANSLSPNIAQAVVVKSLPAVRVACLHARATGPQQIGEVIGPLFARLDAAVRATGATPSTSIAVYEEFDEEGSVAVTAAMPYDGAPAPGFEVASLPAVARAATSVHHGSMSTSRTPGRRCCSGWPTLG